MDIERGGDPVGQDNAEERQARHIGRDRLHQVLKRPVLKVVVLILHRFLF
jgi:hypothetical protein